MSVFQSDAQGKYEIWSDPIALKRAGSDPDQPQTLALGITKLHWISAIQSLAFYTESEDSEIAEYVA